MAWWKECQLIFLLGGWDLCPCSAAVTLGAQKLFGLGFTCCFFLLVLQVAFLSLKGCPVCEGSLQQKHLQEGGGKP